jgi:HK97 family phage major capsid protein
MKAEEKEQFLAFGPKIETLQAQLAENDELLAAAEAANEAERTAAAGRIPVDADTLATDAAQRQAGLATHQVHVGDKPKLGFFGRQLQAVRNIALREATSEDLEAVKMMAGPTGANTDVPSDGGFLIAPQRSNTIVQRMYDTGEIAALVNRIPISNSNGLQLPAIDETSRADGSRFGGIASGWLGQGNTLTAGKPKFRMMDMKLRKVGAFVYSTDELLADAVAFEAWVNQNLPKELAFRVEDAIINGDGSNKPAGILNSGAAITVTRNTAARVLYEDVSGMWKRMWAPLRKGAVWCIDQSVEQDLEQLAVSIGAAGVLAPIYKPAGVAVGPDGTQGYSPATLYGRPILTTEYGAALGTVGDIILTNFGEYTVIDKGGVDQAVSLHVAFLTDEAVYRFMYRVDGQSNWHAALTPKSGGATLSPIVTLT